jgi:glutathionyl-hydroquinone reductase
MAKKLLVYYLGDDEAYYKTLHRDFKSITRLDADFHRIFESEESKIQSLFVKISKELPDLVYIDYSKATTDYLHLTRLISRTPLEKLPNSPADKIPYAKVFLAPS